MAVERRKGALSGASSPAAGGNSFRPRQIPPASPPADPIAIWRAEHADFARLLRLLGKEIAVFHTGEQPNYDLLIDIVNYLRHFPDRFHHPREDVALACLVRKDPSVGSQVDRLLQEHRIIATAGDALLKYLNQAAEDATVRRETIEASAATYLVYYSQHLTAEESEVLPRAAKLLTRQDWAAVAAAVPAGPDPLFGNEFEPRYRELRRQIALESR